jgi:hypothetical protein
MSLDRVGQLACCGILLFAATLAVAAEGDRNKEATIDAAQADADFAVQGEYSGTVMSSGGEEKCGVQVIALGDGKFRAVVYPGGLPGDGWIGEGKFTVEGATEEGVTRFKNEHAVGTVVDGKMRIADLNGNEFGKCEKVERTSPTLGMKAPEGAVVLFDGTSADNFDGGKLTAEGWLEQGMSSRQKFGDCTLHLEFMLSYMPYAREQGRSNSGCYLQGRYEVQILDSFGLEGEDNECGGIYGVKAPDVNMCFPPLVWQTYDIEFTAARYDEQGQKMADARMTVRHNGVVIHQDVPVSEPTRGASVAAGPEKGPIYIQDHGNPLRFRNIWLVAK